MWAIKPAMLTNLSRGVRTRVRDRMCCCCHAGSERVGKSEATGDRLEEAKHINKSLSALGEALPCIILPCGHVMCKCDHRTSGKPKDFHMCCTSQDSSRDRQSA